MEEKRFRLLQLEDDERGIDNIVAKIIDENPIDIYADYRDTDNIEELLNNCDNIIEFEDDIIRGYDECVYDDQRALLSVVTDELHKHYDFDALSDSLEEYIMNSIMDQCVVNYPFNEFLNKRIRVNLITTFDGSRDAEEDELDYKTISKLLIKLGYTQPRTIIKECINNTYNKNDKFLSSLSDEILNSYKDQFNYLTFIGTLTVKEYFDPYQGGGSLLGLNLPQVLNIRGDCVKKILIEGCNKKYTVDQVYGLTSECWQPITLVKGRAKKENK